MSEEELRRAFIGALPDRLVGLQVAFDVWRESPTDMAALEELYRLSHNLAGAGALYGFEEISAPCRTLECGVRALMNQLDEGRQEEALSLKDALNTVKAEAELLCNRDVKRVG